VHTQAHIFDFKIFKNGLFWAFLGAQKLSHEKTPSNLRNIPPQAIHILFGVQTTGADSITPQNKYVHTQAHTFDAEISAKMAILEGFRGQKNSLLKIVPKQAQ
jgi:hypothetical protein